jgi:O-methyltransferase
MPESRLSGGSLAAWSFAPRLVINHWKVKTASHPFEHLHMIRQILRLPRGLSGCVVECGTYKGGSAASLSLACARTKRKLHIFDSFAGLPEPKECDHDHRSVGTSGGGDGYRAGDWAGTLEEVRSNIARCGRIDSCSFHQGLFCETLPAFSESVVLAFVDVDLRSSIEDCVRWLWPLLRPGCRLYTHEAADISISGLFFDKQWWHQSLNCAPPGLVGAGNGLGLVPGPDGFRSDLGFAVKSESREESQSQSI